ncbi:MAG: hypothetical protein K6D94_03185 [Clostridiales bacterium]|nr:hypothetical protein [Clostridiales bacterium]
MQNKKNSFSRAVSAVLAILSLVSASSCALRLSDVITIRRNLDGTPVTTAETTAPPIITEAPTTAFPEHTEAPETAPETLPDGDVIVTAEIPQPLGEIVPVEQQDNFAIAKAYLTALPQKDFKDVAVNIMTSSAPLFMPENVGDPIDNARIERNGMIEAKYNTRIICFDVPTSEIYQSSREAVMSGEYYTDLIAVPQNWLGSFAMSNLLMNLRSLPFTDYSAPYFDQAAMQQSTTQFNIWGAYGCFNEDPDYFWCLFFNKTLVSKLGLTSPYDYVYKGEWTLDRMEEYAKAARSLSVDGWGSAADENVTLDMLFAASGEHYFNCRLGSVPQQKAAGTTAVSLVKRIRSLMYGSQTVYPGGRFKPDYEGGRAAFYNGQIMFFADHPYVITWFTDMKDDWGVLPMPKASKDQEFYSSYTDRSMPVVAVIKNSATTENAGLFLQAANAASYRFIEDVWYDRLARDVIRDGDTLNMLDVVFGRGDQGKAWVDFSVNFGESLPYIGDAGYKLMRSCAKNGRDYAAAVKATMATVRENNAEKFRINPTKD